MSGASSAPATSSAVTIPAATVTGERRKLQKRSLSPSRRSNGRLAAFSAMRGRAAVEAQARVDHVVEKIDDEIDDDEEEGDEHEVGRHHGNVGEIDGLHDQEAHARPLEDGLGDDRKRED